MNLNDNRVLYFENNQVIMKDESYLIGTKFEDIPNDFKEKFETYWKKRVSNIRKLENGNYELEGTEFPGNIRSEHQKLDIFSEIYMNYMIEEFYLAHLWHKFAEENNILYSVFAGNLIGYYRGNDHIIWDDDFDIIMREKNWETLEKIWNNSKEKIHYYPVRGWDIICWQYKKVIFNNVDIILIKFSNESGKYSSEWGPPWYKIKLNNRISLYNNDIGGIDIVICKKINDIFRGNIKIENEYRGTLDILNDCFDFPKNNSNISDFPIKNYGPIKLRIVNKNIGERCLVGRYGQYWIKKKHPNLIKQDNIPIYKRIPDIKNKIKKKLISFIILASGNGIRFNSNIPKQFITINGKTILDITIEKIEKLNYKKEIIIVCNNSYLDSIKKKYKEYKVICGKDTRFLSFMEGFKNVSNKSNIVLVHDAVRLLAIKLLYDNLINKLVLYDKIYKAVIPVINNSSSIIKFNNNNIENIDRSIIKIVQTPECFDYNTLKQIIEYNNNFIESNKNRTSIYSLLIDKKINIATIYGDENNIKITTKKDLDIATYLLNKSILPVANDYNFNNKKALILGGTDGIGLSIYNSLKEKGCYVEKYGSKLKLENKDSLDQFVDKEWDIIVHSAGTLSYNNNSIIKDFKDITFDEWEYCNRLMYLSCYHISKLALRSMKNGGHLLFIGSSSVLKGRKNYSCYTPPKIALNNFVECISEEFIDNNIKVNIIHPSRTKTKMRNYIDNNLSKDHLFPEDVSKIALRYLSSNETGQSYLIRVGDKEL